MIKSLPILTVTTAGAETKAQSGETQLVAGCLVWLVISQMTYVECTAGRLLQHNMLLYDVQRPLIEQWALQP